MKKQRAGISKPTPTSIANMPAYNTNTDTIDAMCMYFEYHEEEPA